MGHHCDAEHAVLFEFQAVLGFLVRDLLRHYSVFTLFWIFPYALFTPCSRSWLTR